MARPLPYIGAALRGESRSNVATVIIWARDLEIGNLPPVCAMSGRSPEVRLRFAFRTTPREAAAATAGAHPVARGLAGAVVEDVVALRAKGKLPLTRGMRRLVWAGRIGPAVALVIGLFLLTVSESLWHSDAAAATGFWLFALALPVGALFNWRVEPHGKLVGMQGALLLRLSNVHPKFAAAAEANMRTELGRGTSVSDQD